MSQLRLHERMLVSPDRGSNVATIPERRDVEGERESVGN